MIARLRGIIRKQTDSQILVEVNGVSYAVLMPPAILRSLPDRLGPSNEIELVTFHYQTIEVGRGFSVLIGFLSEIEREFFERFISVSGIGPKAATKALTLPIPVIARAIDEGDLALLKSLPGVGEQRGKEIIAKLQGKVGKFALIQTRGSVPQAPTAEQTALEEEAVAILVQLEYKKPEAKQMVRAALERNPKASTAEELLNEVYRQQRLAPTPTAALEGSR